MLPASNRDPGSRSAATVATWSQPLRSAAIKRAEVSNGGRVRKGRREVESRRNPEPLERRTKRRDVGGFASNEDAHLAPRAAILMSLDNPSGDLRDFSIQGGRYAQSPIEWQRSGLKLFNACR